MTYVTWGIAPAIAGSLEQLGWTESDSLVGQIMPALTRGTNAVVIVPPAPAWGTAALAALLGSRTPGDGRILLLTSPAMVPQWGAVLHQLTAGTGLRIEAARGTARASRRIKADQVDVLVATPETAIALHSRSTLSPERFTAVVFAWPEDWDADEAVTVLLQDLPRDSQRLVLTSRLDRVEQVVERYARRAVRVGLAPINTTQVGPVRTIATPWANRAGAIAEAIESLDPAELTVWCADAGSHDQLRAALGGIGEGIKLISREIPASGTVICYDLPDLDTLRQLMVTGDVILLVTPGTERYVESIATPRRPLQLHSATSTLMQRDATMRATIANRLASADDNALYLLAPLFERHEAQHVAAVLYRLWREAVEPRAVAAVMAAPVASQTPVGGVRHAKVWVGVGKKDDATTADLVAVLVREVGLERGLIGRIEVKETFSMVEVPADDAERIAQRLVGLTIRRRKISARVDTGRESGMGHGAPRSEARGQRPDRGDRPPRRRE